MKSEIDLSDVSNCFSSQGIYIRLENIDREKKKKKEIIFSRNFILPFILHAMINIAYVESDESTFLEGSARSIASLNHRAARIKKRRKGWRRGEKGTYIWRIRESNQLFEETLHRRYERRNFPLRIQPHFSVADINQVEARLNKLCGDFRVRLVEALKNLTGKKKIGARTQRKTRKKNIYIYYTVRCVRANKNTNINSDSDTPIKILVWKGKIYAFILLDREFPRLSIPSWVSSSQLLISFR